MLRDYQIELAQQGAKKLLAYGLVYYAFQMRVGKTLTALETCNLIKAKNALFITAKKARKSIENDFKAAGYSFLLDVINYEAIGKIVRSYDVIIGDEAHNFGAYPKPSQRTQKLQELVGNSYLILLSGTPTPESWSQIFHQLNLSKRSPFAHYKNFYKWAKDYVTVTQRKYNGINVNDYSKANQYIIEQMTNHLFITYTQQEAGFEQKEINELIIDIETSQEVKALMQYLIKNRVYELKQQEGAAIVCDSAVKLQSKLHQLSSGTVKTTAGGIVLDTAKAQYIKENYAGKKIAIFYKYIAERKAIEDTLGKQNLTDSPEEFNQAPDKIFVSQIKSGALGINLSTADILIFYNIDFSSQLYWQARERMQTLTRKKEAVVHWLFNNVGIEHKIYDTVMKKKDYTNYYFKKDYLC